MKDFKEVSKEIIRKDFIILLSIIASFIIGGIFYEKLPNQIPSSWNFKGEVIGYSGRFAITFILPIICLLLYLLQTIIPYIDPRKKNYDRFSKVFSLWKQISIFFFLVLYGLILANGLGAIIDIQKILISIFSLILIILGNSIGKIKPNYFIGIRTPWTIGNEEVWRRTHRMSAPLWTFGGLISLTMSLLEINFYRQIFAGTIITISIFSTMYSFVLYTKLIKGSEK